MPAPRDKDESRHITFNNLAAGIVWLIYYLVALGIAALIIFVFGLGDTRGAHITWIIFGIIGVVGLVWYILDIRNLFRLK